MLNVKRCEKCYKIISTIDSADWFSHMSIKYCDECRVIVKREQNAARVAAFRQRKREADKAKDARIRELTLENEILREKFAAMLKI